MIGFRSTFKHTHLRTHTHTHLHTEHHCVFNTSPLQKADMFCLIWFFGKDGVTGEGVADRWAGRRGSERGFVDYWLKMFQGRRS